MIATNSFWYRSRTLELDFPLTKRARYSTLSLRPRNTAPAWVCASAARSSRLTVADSGLRTTIPAEQVSISRWLSLRTPRAWTRGAMADPQGILPCGSSSLTFRSESHSPARSSAQVVSREAALGAWGPTMAGTRPPSPWRTVQSELAAKDLHLLVVGAALPRRQFRECDRKWRQRAF